MNQPKVEKKFCEFCEQWIGQLENYLQLLRMAQTQNSEGQIYSGLVDKLITHHKDYYKFKWDAVHEDVLAFFNPVWFSPLENACVWFTDWKPSMVLGLLEKAKDSGQIWMSEEQVNEFNTLKSNIRTEVKKVDGEIERHQVKMADHNIMKLVHLENIARESSHSATMSQVNGFVNVALKSLLDDCENLVRMADCVRLKTLGGILNVLNPLQSVQFFTAMSTRQIKMRRFKKKIE